MAELPAIPPQSLPVLLRQFSNFGLLNFLDLQKRTVSANEQRKMQLVPSVAEALQASKRMVRVSGSRVSESQAAVCQGFGCFYVRDPGSCVPGIRVLLCQGLRHLCARDLGAFVRGPRQLSTRNLIVSVSGSQAAVCQGSECFCVRVSGSCVPGI
jgi:hypothetical protein